jgi:uncharacterized protein (TIGR02594 family)
LHLLLALKELGLGVAEIPGAAANPRIALYLASVGQPGSDEIPWCSAFAHWCITEAGGIGTGKPNARSWLAWGKEIQVPQIGAIAVFKRGTGWQGHVGFVLDVSPGRVCLLGGNQGDRVSVAMYGAAELLGYRRAMTAAEQQASA